MVLIPSARPQSTPPPTVCQSFVPFRKRTLCTLVEPNPRDLAQFLLIRRQTIVGHDGLVPGFAVIRRSGSVATRSQR